MPTVTINAVEYEVYADLAAANPYLAADFELAAAWAALTDDQKAQALVTSTRYIDRQRWQGEKVSEAQPLAWPRSGAFCNGVEVSSATVPQEIIDASIVLAALIANDPAVQNNSTTGSNIESVKAGSAAVQFFRPTDGTVFPTRAQALAGCLLAGSTGAVGLPFVSGTDETETGIPEGLDFGRTDGFA